MYAEIDCVLIPWVDKKGYALQTRDRDEDVRSFLVWSNDNKRYAQVGITNISQDEIEVTIFDGGKKRERLVSLVGDLTGLLDRAEKLAIQWVAPS